MGDHENDKLLAQRSSGPYMGGLSGKIRQMNYVGVFCHRRATYLSINGLTYVEIAYDCLEMVSNITFDLFGSLY